MAVPYSSSDPIIQAFLNALSLGESGGVTQNNLFLGFGNVDLSGAPTNQYGFPIWGGSHTSAGPTHAAGIFQFEPSTWAGLQSAGNFNFGTVQGQSAAAWTLAQQQDPQLYSQLQSGNIGAIQAALAKTWTSITNPGFANALAGSLPQGGASSAGPFPVSPPHSGSDQAAGSLGPEQQRGLRRAWFHLLRGKQALAKAGVSTPSKQSPTQYQASALVSKERLAVLSKPRNRSVSTPGLGSSALSSSLSASSPLSGQTLPATSRPPQSPPQPERINGMSELSDYIKAHTDFLNVFLPTLRSIVDELPLPPQVTASFNAAYALAPLVITTGAAALSAVNGGKPQPAAMDLAEAFNGGQNATNVAATPAAPAPVETPPAPVGPASILPPPPAPAPTPTPALATLVPPPVPAAAQAPAPAPETPASPPTPPTPHTVDVPAETIDVAKLAQLAASLGYQVVGPGGQIVPSA